jgi:hypothetical protein
MFYSSARRHRYKKFKGAEQIFTMFVIVKFYGKIVEPFNLYFRADDFADLFT